MTAAGVALLAMAAVWVGLGLFWLTHPGPQARTRMLRRMQGVMLVGGAALLTAVAIALIRRS